MNQIQGFLENTTTVQIIDILIAVGIILLFRIFSGTISYIIIRMFKIKEKRAKSIKESAFYSPLKIFFIILGFYLAIVFLKEPLGITSEIMLVAYKAFIIISTLAFARGLAESFTPKSSLYKKIKEKTSRDVEDSMFDFALKIIRFVIYIIAGFIIVTALGVNLNGLVAGLGIGGVIFTFYCRRLDTSRCF